MSTSVHRAPRVVGRRIEGQLVLVALPSLEAHVLNDVGARVWELADGRSLDEIVRALSEEFDAPTEVLARDVRAFVASLVDRGALVVESR